MSSGQSKKQLITLKAINRNKQSRQKEAARLKRDSFKPVVWLAKPGHVLKLIQKREPNLWEGTLVTCSVDLLFGKGLLRLALFQIIVSQKRTSIKILSQLKDYMNKNTTHNDITRLMSRVALL